MKTKKVLPISALSAALLFLVPISSFGQVNKPEVAQDQELVDGAVTYDFPGTREENQRTATDRQNDNRNDRDTRHADLKKAHGVNPTTASDILGMDLKSSSDENIGSVDEVFVDLQSGKIVAIAVSTGGFLGIGDSQTLISPRDVYLDSERDNLHTSLTKDQLTTAPRFDKNRQTDFNQVRPLTAIGNRADEKYRDGEVNRDRTDRNRTDKNDANRRDNKDRRDSFRADRVIALSDLDGATVENYAGENIGSINEVYLYLSKGKVAGVVVSTGGFLGIANQRNILAPNEFTYNAEDDSVRVDLDKERLRQAPVYREDDYTWVSTVHGRAKGDKYATGAISANQNRNNDAVRDRDNNANRNVNRNDNNRNARNADDISAQQRLSESIRQSILNDETLSNRARNVTIETTNNTVTLSGEVDSVAEKAAVERIAREQAGNRNVTSNLKINPPK